MRDEPMQPSDVALFLVRTAKALAASHRDSGGDVAAAEKTGVCVSRAVYKAYDERTCRPLDAAIGTITGMLGVAAHLMWQVDVMPDVMAGREPVEFFEWAGLDDVPSEAREASRRVTREAFDNALRGLMASDLASLVRDLTEGDSNEGPA